MRCAYVCGECIYLPLPRCCMPSFAWPSGLTRPATASDGWPVDHRYINTPQSTGGLSSKPDPPRSAPRPRPVRGVADVWGVLKRLHDIYSYLKRSRAVAWCSQCYYGSPWEKPPALTETERGLVSPGRIASASVIRHSSCYQPPTPDPRPLVTEPTVPVPSHRPPHVPWRRC